MDGQYSTGSLVTIACALFASTLFLDGARHAVLKSWGPYFVLSFVFPALHTYCSVPWGRLWLLALVLVSGAAAYGQHRSRVRSATHEARMKALHDKHEQELAEMRAAHDESMKAIAAAYLDRPN